MHAVLNRHFTENVKQRIDWEIACQCFRAKKKKRPEKKNRETKLSQYMVLCTCTYHC